MTAYHQLTFSVQGIRDEDVPELQQRMLTVVDWLVSRKYTPELASHARFFVPSEHAFAPPKDPEHAE